MAHLLDSSTVGVREHLFPLYCMQSFARRSTTLVPKDWKTDRKGLDKNLRPRRLPKGARFPSRNK
jgi:hypothetical protein